MLTMGMYAGFGMMVVGALVVYVVKRMSKPTLVWAATQDAERCQWKQREAERRLAALRNLARPGYGILVAGSVVLFYASIN